TIWWRRDRSARESHAVGDDTRRVSPAHKRARFQYKACLFVRDPHSTFMRSMMATVIVSACVLAQLRAQFEEPSRFTPSIQFDSEIRGPFPNVELPARVQAPSGKLTVFADFGKVVAKGLPVYI